MAAIFVDGRVRGPGDVFMKLWVVVVVVLSLNPAHQLVGVEGARNLSEEEEDLEMEMQLQTLNKPPVKTIHTEWGDIFDCINIHQQPAFDHPLLKNHKIQMKPSVLGRVRDVPSSLMDKNKKSSFKTPVETCPKGTVPIRRTQKEDLIRAKSLSSPSSLSRINSGGSTENNDPTQKYAGLIYQVIGETFYGATAGINIYNPIVANDQISSAVIALESGPADQYNGIHFGWMVNPVLFRDNLTRTYTYWTADGGKTGCYNTLCAGFVQVHKQITPGYPLHVSTYDGAQYETNARVFRDNETKNWWLQYQGNINVGYWPNSLFPLFSAGAQYIYWGGNVKTGGDGVSPQMGSGHWPDGKYTHACYFVNMQYVNGSYVQLNPKEDNMVNKLECSHIYGLRYYGFQKDLGHTFQFGGPGGRCD